MLRAARRRRDWETFEGLAAAIENSSRVKEALAYERALRCRDKLNFTGLAASIGSVKGDDAARAIRRAALHCDLSQDNKAAETLFEVWKDLKERRARDRQLIWLLSREAWTAWLMKRVNFMMRDNPSEGLR
ncbi:hypothetical protein IVB18_41945 [Bradyrhizobium sp. 186]|uniref:hypothetical protein n=1 Tax=Bradyrhizobium sp. 186 TaxID=2782654 RepID=UPI0020015768|nr:hypothetical protein [Bradyrhizobium sp. 186]UPK34544.1 hypothetical protein IVB18_41945 [Bradyrhizobium sp. 186]